LALSPEREREREREREKEKERRRRRRRDKWWTLNTKSSKFSSRTNTPMVVTAKDRSSESSRQPQVAGISSDHEYAFVLEPRLHESVLFDFLVKDPAIMELSFRTEVERKKARIRFDGDELADYAARCIENGERAQEIGQFKDANRC
jgi:hypothetical protein